MHTESNILVSSQWSRQAMQKVLALKWGICSFSFWSSLHKQASNLNKAGPAFVGPQKTCINPLCWALSKIPADFHPEKLHFESPVRSFSHTLPQNYSISNTYYKPNAFSLQTSSSFSTTMTAYIIFICSRGGDIFMILKKKPGEGKLPKL